MELGVESICEAREILEAARVAFCSVVSLIGTESKRVGGLACLSKDALFVSAAGEERGVDASIWSSRATSRKLR